MQPADEFVHVEFRSRPQRIDGVRDVREVQSRGGAGLCVIAGPEDRGELYCWGRGAYNFYGAIWSDSWDEWRYPHRIGPYSDIRSFTQYGTVIRADNTEWAWDGHAGELWTRSELSVGSVMKMGGGAVWVREGLRRSESFARFYAAGVFTIPGIVDFAAGDEHSCALTSGGRVFCWGRNEAGQAGNFDLGGRCGVPDVMDRGNCVRTPTPIPGIDDAVAITADPYRGCVIRRDRTVWCWGSNGSLTPGGPGTLGDGLPPRETCGRDFFGDTWDCARRPVQVVGLRDAVEVSTGGSGPICAVVSSGQVYCWGSGGAYIDGTTEERTTPTLVRW